MSYIFKKKQGFFKIHISFFNINCILVTHHFMIKMNRIKEVLNEKGLKQTWLAKKLDKSYNMVNRYVQNRQQPRLEVLNKIANILEVDIKDLIVSNK